MMRDVLLWLMSQEAIGAAAVMAISPFHAKHVASELRTAVERARDSEDGELLEVRATLAEQRGDHAKVAKQWLDRGQLERIAVRR